MSKEHDWQLQGPSTMQRGLGDVHVWVCSRCHIKAKFASKAMPMPGFRADLHPCDEMVVKTVMES